MMTWSNRHLPLQENMMTASNLSICVGPSILWSSDQAYMMDQNYSKEVADDDYDDDDDNTWWTRITARR